MAAPVVDYYTRALSEDCLPLLLPSSVSGELDKSVLDARCLSHDTLLPLIPTASYDCVHFQKLLGRLREKLLPFKDGHLVLSLSGGVDSMTHLLLLNALKPELGFELSACHIRHSSRPEEALQEERWVQWVAGKVGIHLYSHHVEVNRPHGETKSVVSRDDFEELTRKVRFAMYRRTWNFRQISDCLPTVVIGHHLDDVDENRLAELGKGSLVDVNGMGPEERMEGCLVLRPLCNCTRKSELIDTAQSLKLPYMHNSTPVWSRRGWIRAVIDGLGSEFLEDLEICGKKSGEISKIVKNAISQWKKEKGLKKFNVIHTSKSDSVDLTGFILNIGLLFDMSINRLAVLISEFSTIVDKIAQIWNPAFTEYAASFPEVNCPIQPIRQVPADLKPLILFDTLLECFSELKDTLKNQLPSKVPLRSFLDAAAATTRPALNVLLHKKCPGVYFRQFQSLVIVDNWDDLLNSCGGKSDIAASALLKAFLANNIYEAI